jgi:hypothetical protein
LFAFAKKNEMITIYFVSVWWDRMISITFEKSLYGLKTSAARFHEHLNESFLRLGFKKAKHDTDLWIVDKSSHYEYLATYVVDILIRRKDPMAVIKSLEKT